MIRQKLHRIAALILVALTTASLAGCGSRVQEQGYAGAQTQGAVPDQSQQSSAGQPAATATATQDEILQAQADRIRKTQVTVGAFVCKMLPDDRKGLPHEKFLIGLNNNTTVLVAHDIAMAPYVPLHAGDYVVIHGEYKWTNKGGVLHWTHHTDTPNHEGGWIDFAGKRYQ